MHMYTGKIKSSIKTALEQLDATLKAWDRNEKEKTEHSIWAASVSTEYALFLLQLQSEDYMDIYEASGYPRLRRFSDPREAMLLTMENLQKTLTALESGDIKAQLQSLGIARSLVVKLQQKTRKTSK